LFLTSNNYCFYEANYYHKTTNSNSKCYQKMLLQCTTDHAD
jgi:hypothetical protein